MELSQKNNFLQWVAAGSLLGAGFLFPPLWIFGIVGVSWIIVLSLSTQSIKKLVVGSLAAGTIKAAAALFWFWSVYPIVWLAFDLGRIQLILIFFYWITAALWLGTAVVIFALVAKKLSFYLRKKLLLPLIPFVWMFSEIVGSLIFSVITIGEGGVITSAFSFGFVGYLLAQHNILIFGALFGGVYMLGLLFVGVAAGLLCIESKHHYIGVVAGVLCVVYATAYVPLVSRDFVVNDEAYSVVTIDTTFPPNQIRTPEGAAIIRTELDAAMDVALNLDSDYILLPEDARYFNQYQNINQTKAIFQFQKSNPATIIVDSSRALSGDDTVLQSYVYNGVENTVDQSHKRYLVPQGEFMPALYVGVLQLFGFGELTEKIAQDISFTVGPKVSQSEFAQTSPGVLFCFESVSPWGVRTILQERGEVPFIAHPISHAWFHDSEILWVNLDSMLRVQAIWNQQYIVSVGSHVSGQVFTPNGSIQTLDEVTSGDGWIVRQTSIPKKERD